MSLGNRRLGVGVLFFLILLFLPVFVFATINLAVTSPTSNNNHSGLVDINFTFDGTVNYTIQHYNGSVWTLLNASNESSSPVHVVWNTTTVNDGFYSLNITAVNATNSSHVNNTIISDLLIDNTAPVIEGVFFNTTILSDESEQIFFSINVSDAFSHIDSVVVDYEMPNPLNNVSNNTPGEIVRFEGIFNASQLNCTALAIVCPISVFVNDSLGNFYEKRLFTLLIDTDTPVWSEFTVSPSNYTTPGATINFSALWTDHSLNVSQESFAELFKNNGTDNTSIGSVALNNETLWSNFSYTVLEEDLVEELTFFITYTDLVGRSNTTDPIEIFVDDAAPIFVNVSVSNSTGETSFIVLNSTQENELVIVSESASGLLNISFVLEEQYPNSTALFKFTDASMNNPLLVNELGAVTSGSFLVDATPGINIFTLRARDKTFPSSQEETNLSFTVLYNPLVNVSEVRERLEGVLTTPAQDVSLRIIREGINISSCESCYLNGSVGFEINFSSEHNSFFVEVEPQNGLHYFWNNNFSLYNTAINSLYAGAISEVNNKMDIEEFWFSNNYTFNFNNITLGHISPLQRVNWTIETSSQQVLHWFAGLPWIFYPQKCGEDININDIQDSCYERDSENNITRLFTYGFGGVILGNATGAPNITSIVPEQEEEITDSFFDFSFLLTDFAPVQEGVCVYNITRNNETITDGFRNLSIDDFGLSGFTFDYSQRYNGLLNNDNYSWSITCFNTLGLNTTVVHDFSVNDTKAPTISDIIISSRTTSSAIISASSNELAQFTIYYDTDDDNFTKKTTTTDFVFNISTTLSSLLADTEYFFVVEACDINNNCANHTGSPSSFETLQVFSDTTTPGSGGFGGATGGTSTEGSIKRSHAHSWDVLRSGFFVHSIRDVQLPVAQLRLFVEQDTNSAFLTVRTFHGRPGLVPELAGVHEYFEINHHGLTGSGYEVDFRVPQGSEEVRFWRFEDAAWIEYSHEFNQTVGAYDLYTVRLPGFSYFAITLGEAYVESEPVVVEQTPAPVEEDELRPSDQVVVVSDGEGPLPVLDRSWTWLLYTFLFVLTLGGLGAGAFYAYTIGLFDKKALKKSGAVVFNKNDPFYNLQVFINSELDKGVSSSIIRQELVDAGWDDLIVDEELEKVMSLRV